MTYSPDSPMHIGTRGSPLALAQAVETRSRLMCALGLPEEAFEIHVIKTTGDRIQNRSLGEIGGKGLFTREIEVALLRASIDIAVHSMKDVPVEQPGGLVIDCILPREDVRDGLLSPTARCISELPKDAVVGSSSLRRRAQLKYRRADLQLVEFRGNVQTRLQKLSDGVAQATMLAMAGLNRLNMPDGTAIPIDTGEILPAIAQGAIGIERRADDEAAAVSLALINDRASQVRILTERSFLKGLDGSCQTPIAGLAELHGDQVTLRGEVLRPDGTESHFDEQTGIARDGAAIGAELAARLRLRMGPDFF